MLERKKDRTAAIQQSLLNGGDLYPLSFFDSRKYIQHNVLVGDGLANIYAYMDALPRGKRSVRVCRAVEDGDYTFVHNAYLLGDQGPMAAFEVQRWEDDRIVEHWDNLQAIPRAPNPSGRTMTDGASEVVDLEQTHDNKARVERYTQKVLVGGDQGSLASYFQGDLLLQHNPTFGDGVAALKRWLTESGSKYVRLHKVLGEGNFVLTMSEGHVRGSGGGEQPTAFFDLYRLDAGSIAEHWDVIEAIPPRDKWVHDNGKF